MNNARSQVASLLFALTFVPLCGAGLWGCCDTAEGNGDVRSETREVAGFSDLSVDGRLDVHVLVEPRAEPSLLVRTDSNLLPLIHSTSRAGWLDVSVEDGTHLEPSSGAFADATTAGLASASANNGAFVELSGLAGDLDLAANNGATLDALAVQTQYAEIDANNGGRVLLSTGDADVSVANGGVVELCATGVVRGNVRNGGDLRVRCGGRDLTTRR